MFKVPMTKYKNAAGKMVKKDFVLNGISTNRLSNTIGSLIDCSMKNITFALDSSSGGSVCTLRYDDLARRMTFSNDGQVTVSHAHSGPITDIQYNSFNPDLFATSGYDAQIQLWNVTDPDSDNGSPLKVDCVTSLPLNEMRCDCIQWNPNVNNIMATASMNTLYLWDIQKESRQPVSVLRNHSEAIQSLSWKRDGSMLVTTSKDKTMQIIDPRTSDSAQNNHLVFSNSKTANKDSKAVWLGSSNSILTSVYSMSHQRELYLWDIRNTDAPVHETSIDQGNNVLTPLYDHDTSMLFLIGKAETMVRYAEILNTNELSSDSWTIQCNMSQPVDDQIKSFCMMPKFSLDLMKCEINRLLLLTRNSVYPLPFFVPRRSYYDFHSDIFPDTFDTREPALSKDAWLDGCNADAIRIELNPNVQRQFSNKSGSSVPTTPKTPTTPPITPSIPKQEEEIKNKNDQDSERPMSVLPSQLKKLENENFISEKTINLASTPPQVEKPVSKQQSPEVEEINKNALSTKTTTVTFRNAASTNSTDANNKFDSASLSSSSSPEPISDSSNKSVTSNI
jgi:coronin-7